MFIIDGNNLLHTVNKIEGDFQSINDVDLCKAVGVFLRLTGQTGEVIFDGAGPRDKTGFDNIENLEVFFSGLKTDTDTVIENKIKASTAPKRLVIVSSDRRLRKAAHIRKAASVKSGVFWINLQKVLSRKTQIREPQAKRKGLSEGETEQWMDFFGLK
jgi:hypothetical protein